MGTMLRLLLVGVTLLTSWVGTSQSASDELEQYLIRDDTDQLYIVEVEGNNGTSIGVQERHSYKSPSKIRSGRKQVKKEHQEKKEQQKKKGQQKKKKENKKRKERPKKQEKKTKKQKKGK